MLNMGFVDDVETILNAGGSQNIQTLLFSATLPSWVKDIQKRFLKTDFKLVDLVGNEKQKVLFKNPHPRIQIFGFLVNFMHKKQFKNIRNEVH